jgi:hypothetical protein
MTEPTEHQDPRWIALNPSNTNLVLTLSAGLVACAALWLIDIPEWARALILLIAFVVLSIDVYMVRLKSRDAVGAFYLFERDVVVLADGDVAQSPLKELCVRIRYRNTGNTGKLKSLAEAEVEGVVHKAPYVSTYFSTIPYRLPNDPAWRRYMPRIISLWADSLDREQFRQVRVQLKWRQ